MTFFDREGPDTVVWPMKMPSPRHGFPAQGDSSARILADKTVRRTNLRQCLKTEVLAAVADAVKSDAFGGFGPGCRISCPTANNDSRAARIESKLGVFLVCSV